jgi:hypothetical protein
MTQPKVLILDIETSPIIGYLWSIWQENIGLNMVKADWHIMSFCAKWLGSKDYVYYDQRNEKNIEDDKKLLKIIWKLMDEADAIVGQNSKQFDEKKLNARFILNGMQPPSPYKSIDTKLIAKSKFSFTSNKLEYLSEALNKQYKKLKHSEFEGFELWKECLKGNMKAWECMKTYNIHDVLATEELYLKLRPWSKDFNVHHYNDTPIHDSCNNCGGHVQKRGFHYTAGGKYQYYRCVDCGSSQRDSNNLFTKEKRSSLRKTL